MAIGIGQPKAHYAVTGSIEPARITTAYRLGLLVVALAMLVLPLIYLGLIAAAARLVWWHVTANTWILNPERGSSLGLWRLVFYFGPAAAGAAVVFFMIKPVLAKAARGTDPVPVGAAVQPVLYEFIRAICQQVGAPFPTRVQVDCQVNASAGFARTPWSLGQTDLVLTIGLPLAAGLTVRQFAGVLAHEFGHFAQTGGMRLTFIVRSISHWLARVAHERDQWDESLEEWASSGSWAVVLTFRLAQAAVWMSRKILSGLMRAGHVISSFMLRQMEYDADSYEVKLVGTPGFISTSTRLRELNAGAHFGYQDLQDAWARRTLPANLPQYLLGHTGRLPAGLLERIRELPTDKTSLFDTHPADADRVRAAEEIDSQGIFVGGDEPASVLFENFEALGVTATRHHYSQELGLPLDQTTLIDTESAVSASREREKHNVSIAAFFGEALSFIRPVRLPWPVPAMDARTAATRLRGAREQMERDRASAAAAMRQLEDKAHARHMAVAASEVLQAGFTKIVAADFRLTDASGADARRAEESALESMRALEPELQRFEALAAERMTCAVALLSDASLGVETVASLQAELTRVVPALNDVARVWPSICSLYDLSMTSDLVSGNAAKSPDQVAATRQTGRLAGQVHAQLRRLRDDLRSAPGPAPSETLASIVGFSETGDELPPVATVIASASAIRFDLIGRVVSVVLAVEAGVEANERAKE